jgi:hypothetical protein
MTRETRKKQPNHDEALRQKAEELKGDMVSNNQTVREEAAEEFKSQSGLETSNGAPASNRAAHRRH